MSWQDTDSTALKDTYDPHNTDNSVGYITEIKTAWEVPVRNRGHEDIPRKNIRIELTSRSDDKEWTRRVEIIEPVYDASYGDYENKLISLDVVQVEQLIEVLELALDRINKKK
jgi:hypothetical protein